ncbi:MAG: tRNA (adenosine(37)-N6)-threonylcarbamoyltransferase complex dimerization subunit type 1 TsaB [Verrucomicrobia bacterium]|nr:tRNA (adenosine(37)-N6)-threonylcarbamoyltransferase complex dimerization subunit type 1 TsaB [Verrucomicrobiota bacterium]
MNRLIIENSGATGTLVVAKDGVIMLDQYFRGAAELAVCVEAVTESAGKPDEIIVGIGPGSYTGLRVAVATVLGMKLALGCRAFGCPSVLGYPGLNYVVIGDARRGTLFLADIRNGVMSDLPRLIPREEVLQQVGKIDTQQLFVTSRIAELSEAEVLIPEARWLVHRESSYTESVEPIYLKEPHITKPMDR